MRILKASGHRVMPWKNSGGTTTEIAAHPEGSDLSTFGWHVSMASVAADGPFSLFPGIDRTLAVLEGDGIDLAIEGQGRYRLTLGSPPHPFPADTPASATLIAGPILDLNVMTRRGVHRHAVERRTIESAEPIAFTAGWTLILPRGPIRIGEEERPAHDLDSGDALLAERGAPSVVLSASASVTTYLVRIELAD